MACQQRAYHLRSGSEGDVVDALEESAESYAACRKMHAALIEDNERCQTKLRELNGKSK